MTVSAPQSFGSVVLPDYSVAFAYAHWFDAQFLLNSDIILHYVCCRHLSVHIPLFALERRGLQWSMCASD